MFGVCLTISSRQKGLRPWQQAACSACFSPSASSPNPSLRSPTTRSGSIARCRSFSAVLWSNSALLPTLGGFGRLQWIRWWSVRCRIGDDHATTPVGGGSRGDRRHGAGNRTIGCPPSGIVRVRGVWCSGQTWLLTLDIPSWHSSWGSLRSDSRVALIGSVASPYRISPTWGRRIPVSGYNRSHDTNR